MTGSTTVFAQEGDFDDATLSQQAAPAKKRPVAKKYPTRIVKGHVLNAANGLPVSGAMISTTGIDGYSALSADDGSYELKVPTFATSIEISAPDHNPVRLGLAAGEQQRDVKLYKTAFSSEYAADNNVLFNEKTADLYYSGAVSAEEDIQRNLGAYARTTSRGGTPGIGSVMFLNGVNSLNANAQPLIVVDGVIFDQQYNRQMLHFGFYNDILANISTADIEHIQVMRNGTALYGAKGANGVILITTKRSHSMATRITASISAGATLEPKYYDMMNATQYKGYASDLLQTVGTDVKNFPFLNDDPTYYYYPQYHNNTDWKDKVYRTAITQDYHVSVEGGDDIASYNLSLGYVANQSTLKYNDMNRLNIRFNTDIKLTNKLDVRFDASFDNITRDIRDDGAPANYTEGTPTSPSFLAYIKSPMLSPYAYANGMMSNSFLDTNDETYLDEALADISNYNYKIANPLTLNEYAEAENKNRFENSMVSLSITPKFQFNPHLFASEHFSYSLINTNERRYVPINGVPDYYVASLNAYRENETRSLFSKQNSVMSDTRIDWNNRYNAHFIHLFGGARINWENYTLKNQLGYDTGNDKTPFLHQGLKDAKSTGANDNWTSMAWYAQAEYNFMERYFVQANLTAETSSRFGSDAKGAVKAFSAPWGLFPGIQAAWVISNEPWMAAVKPVNYLKLSAGYELSGNDDIDYYARRSYFASYTFMKDRSSLSFKNIGNDKLTWETTSRFNVGVEGNFFNNILNLKFNYFTSNTCDLLALQHAAFITGVEDSWGNGGKLSNKGFDVTATVKALATKDFSWQIGASLGHYKNEITEMPTTEKALETSLYGATIRTEKGHAIGSFYGLKSLGVFSSTAEAEAAGLYVLDANGIDKHYFGAGDVHYADFNGDHQINDNDRTYIGDPNPDVFGNIFTSLQYKQWRLDVNFNYSLGGDVYNYMRSQLESGSRFMNQTLALTNRWQNEGQVTDIPRVTFKDPLGNSAFSNRWIEDGSYLKLKTITLSYDLPVNSQYFQGFQFWIQANNVLTFTKYLGSDPEFATTSAVLGQGIDAGLLPLSRSFVAGVKINL